MHELPPNPGLDVCPVCGERQFSRQAVLWQELIDAWRLSAEEVEYINLQQGLLCTNCQNNLRSMTLAAAVTKAFRFTGSFQDFCRENSGIRQKIVLEVNAAGALSPFLRLLPRHTQRSFPQLDMQRMNFEDASIDVVIHSDTLEHVPDSGVALKECLRVLKPGGRLFYTIPIVVGRLTKTREGLSPSYHGEADTKRDDYIVRTEYGADFWCEVFEAGFREVSLTSLVFPVSVAICARKCQSDALST